MKVFEPDFKPLFLAKTPWIDVRAPVEFEQGSLPGAINLPIMNNEERALVGTTYKREGREKAIELGHRLVSGAIKESRVQAWLSQARQSPQSVFYCFRGGLRSQISQRWLKEAGVERPLIEGGYKKVRQVLRDEIEQFSQKRSVVMITGTTGSAKTQLLKNASTYLPVLDLEALARHRGSAFGARETPQPAQIDFENQMAVAILALSEGTVLIEDESRMIGQLTVPESLFLKMRSSPVFRVDESLETRIENVFRDYILETPIAQGTPDQARRLFAYYRQAVTAISKKLGGLRSQELLQDLAFCENEALTRRHFEGNKGWISKLLIYYYDPLYQKSLQKRQPKVLFQGTAEQILREIQKSSRGMLTL